jgi:hypothetical protein
MKKTRAGGLVAASALTLTAVLGAPAEAQVEQDGLVNVNVGDVTIAEDVNVGVAALIAAQVCGVDVGPIAVLGRAVDRSGATRTVCESDQGPVTLSQN